MDFDKVKKECEEEINKTIGFNDSEMRNYINSNHNGDLFFYLRGIRLTDDEFANAIIFLIARKVKNT